MESGTSLRKYEEEFRDTAEGSTNFNSYREIFREPLLNKKCLSPTGSGNSIAPLAFQRDKYFSFQTLIIVLLRKFAGTARVKLALGRHTNVSFKN